MCYTVLLMSTKTQPRAGKIVVHVEGTQIGYAVYVTIGDDVTEWHTLLVRDWSKAGITKVYREASSLAAALEYTASRKPGLMRGRSVA